MGKLSHQEAIETALAMARVQDGCAERETGPMKMIFRANAKAQREVADVIEALEAENARMRKALREIRELNMTGADENGHRWANSDLIEQEIVFSGALIAPTAVDDGALKGNDHE